MKIFPFGFLNRWAHANLDASNQMKQVSLNAAFESQKILKRKAGMDGA